jgi:hypothetical protein
MLPPRLQRYSLLIDILVEELAREVERGAETATPGGDEPTSAHKCERPAVTPARRSDPQAFADLGVSDESLPEISKHP